jgi:putative DNA primase/helicase
VRGAANALTWSHCIADPLAILGDEIDKRPLLLPCANGVIDLETGELRPGDPADLLVRAIPIEYLGIDCVNDDWEKFIAEIHQDDPQIIPFVRRLLGYCLTGLTTEHFIACFLGEGANGKGTLFEVLREVMGELAWAIEPEMLLEQKNAKSSAGPSPDIISLHGRRLVIASETDQNRKISPAKTKRLTGGDTLTGRSPHDKYEINFQPSHKIVLYTNHPPRGLASDFGMLRRLIYIWYPLRFVDDVQAHQQRDPQNAHLYRPKDGTLKARLLANPSGILAWLVRGELERQKLGGLKPPAAILAAAEAIRRDEDHLERFVDDRCTRPGPEHWIAFKFFFEQFAHWFSENVDEDKRYIPSKKAIGDQLRRKGYRVEAIGGSARVYGLDVQGHDLG